MMQPNLVEVRPTLRRTDFPEVVVVETVARCNLSCPMCPQPDLKRARGEMPMPLFHNIVDEVARENPDTDFWLAIMGEPLLMGERFIEMVAYAKRQGLRRVHLNSNACLLTEELARGLIHAGLDEIIVGMDAVTEATYRVVRQGGDFHTTVANVERLIALKKELGVTTPRLIMQFIVMDENEHEVEEFKAFWLARGQVVKLRPKLGWGTGVKADNLTLPDSERNFPCPWLIRTVSIQWNGRLNQCDADFEGAYSPGDLNRQSLREIWNGELARRREKHWSQDFSHDLCKQCKDWAAGRSLFLNPPVI